MKCTTKFNIVTGLVLITIFLIMIFLIKDVFEDYVSCIDRGGVMVREFLGGYTCIIKK